MTYHVFLSQHQVECNKAYLAEVWTGPSSVQYLDHRVEVVLHVSVCVWIYFGIVTQTCISNSLIVCVAVNVLSNVMSVIRDQFFLRELFSSRFWVLIVSSIMV